MRASVTLGDVLLAGEGAELKATAGLTVAAEIVAQAKADKVIVFKKRRRHNYRRKNGHRQNHTILKILSIGGEQQQAKADAAPVEATPSAETAAAPTAKKPAAKKASQAETATPVTEA